MDIVFTLLTYFTIYGLVLLAFHVADERRSLIEKKIYIAVGILILAVFGALRHPEVGTDTIPTITMYYNEAYNYSNISSILADNIAASTDIFLIISKVIINLGLGYRTFLFCLELLTIVPIACVAYINRERTRMSITMTIFVFLFFQLGFNWIRQSIAVAFLLLGLILWIEKKKVVSVICLAIGCLFHSSGLIGIAMYVGAWIATRTEKQYLRKLIFIFIILFSLVIMKYWKPIALWLIDNDILPDKYNGYVNVFTGAHGQSFLKWFVIGKKTYVEYMLRIALFFLPILCSNRYMHLNDSGFEIRFAFFKMLAMLSILIYSAGIFVLHTAYVNRVSYLLDIFNIVYLGMICPRIEYKKIYSVTYSELLVIILVLTYNIWLFYIMGWHATVPYFTSIFS